MTKTLIARRMKYEQATWRFANKRRCKGSMIFDAGDLGICVLRWSSSYGGIWANEWFDSIQLMHEENDGQGAKTKHL